MSDLIERLRAYANTLGAGNDDLWADLIVAADEIKGLRAALRAQQPQPIATAPPCDCIALKDGVYQWPRCNCQNVDDAMAAAAWVTTANRTQEK